MVKCQIGFHLGGGRTTAVPTQLSAAALRSPFKLHEPCSFSTLSPHPRKRHCSEDITFVTFWPLHAIEDNGLLCLALPMVTDMTKHSVAGNLVRWCQVGVYDDCHTEHMVRREEATFILNRRWRTPSKGRGWKRETKPLRSCSLGKILFMFLTYCLHGANTVVYMNYCEERGQSFLLFYFSFNFIYVFDKKAGPWESLSGMGRVKV